MRCSLPGPALALALGLAWGGSVSAAIDTSVLEQPWPRQTVRHPEVGRQQVRWRHLKRRRELFTGVRFQAPLDRGTVFRLSTDYADVGRMAPGVKSIRYRERTPERQVIEVETQVLWKVITFTFEVEQEPLRAIRFRWARAGLGEFRGVVLLEDGPPEHRKDGSVRPTTTLEMSTWLRSERPVPLGALLVGLRMVMLSGVRDFVKACERHPLDGQQVVTTDLAGGGS